MTPENIRLKKLLAYVQNELLEQIDGGDEAKHRDSWISGLVRQIGLGLNTDYPYDIGPKITQEAIRMEREVCAMLHESVDPACDHERQNGDPGAGAMGAVIEYRDKIRARNNT